MIARFDEALCALQSATFGREIYGTDHPQVATQVTRAATLLLELLAERPSLSFMAFDDRVVFDDRRLPSGANLASGLIARLRGRGVDCVTFNAGLTEPELAGWLDNFDKDAPTDTAPANTAHILVGSIDDTGEGQPEDGVFNLDPEGQEGFDPTHPGDVAERIFGPAGDGDPDLGAVAGLIEDLSNSVAGASGALLPLATLKHHDEYTSVHTINVAMMAAALAEQVGLPANRVHEIAVGAVLHDLGKRDIASEILNKPGKLTEAEFDIIRGHPAAGASALLQMDDVPEVAVMIAYEHHMFLDGTGYPDGRGRRPHLCSQIVQLADIYDAMRTHRPYRPAMSLDRTTEIMREGAGSRYDADLLDLFFDRVAVRAHPERDEAA